MDEQQKTGWLIAKIASVWAACGISSWSEAASALAALYTLLLILHHVWKNWLRPFFFKSVSEAPNADADA